MAIFKREQREITLPLKGGVPAGGGGYLSVLSVPTESTKELCA